MADSIAAYKKYGVHTSNARYMVHNLFYFPYNYQDILEVYSTLFLPTNKFISSIKEGMIEYKGTHYQVIFYKTDPTKMRRRQEHTGVKLSFRIAKKEYGILPTVLR